jgi:hypothetical protein
MTLVACGKKRGPSGLVPALDVGAGFQKRLHLLRQALLGGVKERIFELLMQTENSRAERVDGK